MKIVVQDVMIPMLKLSLYRGAFEPREHGFIYVEDLPELLYC